MTRALLQRTCAEDCTHPVEDALLQRTDVEHSWTDVEDCTRPPDGGCVEREIQMTISNHTSLPLKQADRRGLR